MDTIEVTSHRGLGIEMVERCFVRGLYPGRGERQW